MKMQRDNHTSGEERNNDTQQPLVPLSSHSQPSNPCQSEDDDVPADDKVTICEIILLSLQHFMVAAGRCVLAVLYIAPSLCLLTDDPIRGLLLARFLLLSGVTTLLQTSIGVRLPLAHAPCLPTLVAVSLALSWLDCPSSTNLGQLDYDERALHIAPRLGEIQGALLLASLVGAAIALVAWFVRRFTLPAIVAAAASIGGALVAIKPVADVAFTNWLSALLVASFTVFLALVKWRKKLLPLPLPACSANRGFHFHWHPIGAVSPVLVVLVAWMTCAILTVAGWISYEQSPLSTSSHRPDRMNAPSDFVLFCSDCWNWPTVTTGETVPLATIAGFSLGILLNWGSWTAVSAAIHPQPQSAISSRCPRSWRGIGVTTLSVVLAGVIGAPAPAVGGADTAGVAFFARAAGTRAAGLLPLRICGILLIFFSLFPAISVAVCSVPLPPLAGISLLLIVASGGSGLLYLESVNLRGFRPRLLLGLVFLTTLTRSFYTFSGQSS